MKYIPAEKLIAEIERRESEIKSQIAELGNFESNEIGLFNYLDLYDGIRSFITSLQQEQPEVDLEKELKNERIALLDAFGPMNGVQSLAIRNLARHFFELGRLNARKEE